mgnify:CR=1 FL=1
MSDADKIRLFFAVKKRDMALNLVREIKGLFSNAIENYNECVEEHNEVVASVRFNITKSN